MVSEAQLVKNAIEFVMADVEELLNIERYNNGNILNAIYFLNGAIGQIDRLIDRDDKERS